MHDLVLVVVHSLPVSCSPDQCVENKVHLSWFHESLGLVFKTDPSIKVTPAWSNINQFNQSIYLPCKTKASIIFRTVTNNARQIHTVTQMSQNMYKSWPWSRIFTVKCVNVSTLAVSTLAVADLGLSLTTPFINSASEYFSRVFVTLC